MRLRDILIDHVAINVLKFLYDMELKNNPYSTKLSNIRQKFTNFQSMEDSINNLKNFELINVDSLEDEQIVSISAKGKHFMDIFDKLIQILEKKDVKKPIKSFQIKYNLTPKEKKIMIVLFKLSKEMGDKPVLVQDLTREIYPANGDKNTSTIKRYATKLAKLNLVEKTEIKNQQYLKLTPTGERTIKEQLVEALL